MSTISLIDLSENLYFSELDSSPDTSIPKIQKWLSLNLGSLNDYIQTSYQASGNNSEPQLSYESAVILAAMFLSYWYSLQIKNNLGASAFQILEVREADSSVRLSNRTEIAKTFLQLKTQNTLYLNNLVNAFKRNNCVPEQLKISGLWQSICGC